MTENNQIVDERDLLTEAQARELTDTIKATVSIAWELIVAAYNQRAWSPLGYSSWDDYCTREFGTSRLRLPREERSEVVSSLRESGLSIRAIAAATNEPVMTVQNELARVRDRTPESEPVDQDEDSIVDEPPGGVTAETPGQTDRVAEALDNARKAELAPVTGLDGKRYQPKPKPPAAEQKPRRKSIVDEMGTAVFHLDKDVRRIVRLVDDDRFNRNRRELDLRNRGDLLRIVDQLNDVIDQLGGGE